MDSEEELTEEEKEVMESLGLGYPKSKEKDSIVAFFKKIISMADTLRTSNLTAEELGTARVPVRTSRQLSTYCDVMGLSGLCSYFKQQASIITDSSLSREGFLDKLAVTQKREMDSQLKMKGAPKQNKGWFKKKPNPEQI